MAKQIGKRRGSALGYEPSRPSPLSSRDLSVWSRKNEVQGTSFDDTGGELSRGQGDQGYGREEGGKSGREEREVVEIPPQILKRFKETPLFKYAPKSLLGRIAAKLTLMQFYPQEYIVSQGEGSSSMFWILKGSVDVARDDGESVCATLGPGSYFGEIGILFNRPRTASVIARTKLLVGVLSKEFFFTVLQLYPRVERATRDDAQRRLAIIEKSVRSNDNVPLRRNRTLERQTRKASRGQQVLVPNSLQVPHVSLTSDNTTNGGKTDYSVTIQSFIETLPLFKKLPPDIMHEVAMSMDSSTFNLFEYILKKGEMGSDMYFVVSGEVEVVDLDEKSCINRSLARLGSGSYFGEMSFLSFLDQEADPQRRSASIRSVTATELTMVKSHYLKGLCDKFPFIVEDIKEKARERSALNLLSIPSSPYPRISIDFLINEPQNSLPSKSAPASQHSDTFFSSNYKLNCPAPSFITDEISRSVSPISNINTDSTNSDHIANINANPTNHDVAGEFNKKRRHQSHSKSLSTLNLSPPSLNPVYLSPNGFHDLSSGLQASSFQYMPHHKRLRMSSISGGRRRSSLLTVESPLPDSILLKIFGYLSLPDLMKLRLLSKRWKELLSISPNLCTTLDLTKWSTSIDAKALISITDFVGPRPEVIDISNCFHITDESFSYMVNEIGISGKIKSFKMVSNWEISAMPIMDLTVPSVGGYLEHIDLSNCHNVSNEVLERLVGWDPEKNKENNGQPINTEGIGCRNLKSINVGYCKHLTDGIMYHLAVNACERLESLNLTRCTSITDKGFEYWTYASFPNLKEICLKDCTFLNDKSIFSLANSASNLRALNLSFCCALTDLSVELLCYGCPDLRDIDLSFCGSAVSDSSLALIAVHLKKLEKLILTGCVRVTRAGVDALLSSSSSLKYLDISQCKNAHSYPGNTPAQKLTINEATKSAFVVSATNKNVVEIVI